MKRPDWRALARALAARRWTLLLLAVAAAPFAPGEKPAWASPPEGAQPAPVPEPATPVAPVAVTVSGACPDSDAIWKAIASIVPAGDLDRFASTAKVEVSDLGDTYRVSVNANGIDRLRVYRDLAHDCDHRARFAAVFIVLTLMPPDVLLDARPPPPPPPPPAPPAPPPPAVVTAAPVVARRPVRLELAFLIDLAPRPGSPLAVALGGELRVAPGPKRVGPVGAVGIAAGSIDFGSVSATELRVPFDLGIRFPLVTRTAFDLVADLGVGGRRLSRPGNEHDRSAVGDAARSRAARRRGGARGTAERSAARPRRRSRGGLPEALRRHAHAARDGGAHARVLGRRDAGTGGSAMIAARRMAARRKQRPDPTGAGGLAGAAGLRSAPQPGKQHPLVGAARDRRSQRMDRRRQRGHRGGPAGHVAGRLDRRRAHRPVLGEADQRRRLDQRDASICGARTTIPPRRTTASGSICRAPTRRPPTGRSSSSRSRPAATRESSASCSTSICAASPTAI